MTPVQQIFKKKKKTEFIQRRRRRNIRTDLKSEEETIEMVGPRVIGFRPFGTDLGDAFGFDAVADSEFLLVFFNIACDCRLAFFSSDFLFFSFILENSSLPEIKSFYFLDLKILYTFKIFYFIF